MTRFRGTLSASHPRGGRGAATDDTRTDTDR
jgi:hypothetical protein